jgi:transmembrane sensor
MSTYNMDELAEKFLKGTISAEEEKVFFDWYRQNLQRDTHLSEDFAAGESELHTRILSAIRQHTGYPAPVVDLRPARRIRRWTAAAAVVLLIVGGGTFFVFRHGKKLPPPLAIHPPAKSFNLAPGRSGALLTLSNGKQITLDSAGNGLLARDAGTEVLASNGAITYQGHTQGAVYNTINTARGRQWSLTLSDGTRVWLNAGSSITYPLVFSGQDRTVSMTGEAYFEVAENAAAPFHVKVNNTIVDVLGTHFNINAYLDEPDVNTTLLEGAVRVSAGGVPVQLRPGEAAISADGQIRLDKQANTEAAVAWKNGRFMAEDAPLQQIMRQISRWYDVEIRYEGISPDEPFSLLNVPRDQSASNMLTMLEMTGRVKFKVEGRKITVTRSNKAGGPNKNRKWF